jgi:MtrB/PioB family decaheme-associated outer membrane protein
MQQPPRRNVSALKQCAAVAVLCALAMPAYADSAITNFSIIGNQLNPTGLLTGLSVDPRGMSQRVILSRSPTGLLYPKPFVFPQMTQSDSDPAWWSSGWAELGFLTDFSENSAAFGEYGDWDTGLIANFGYRAENRETADYFQARAGSIGRGDGFYELRAGRYGRFNIGLFYNSRPHFLAGNARSLWSGAGTANLRLPSDLVPGNVTSSDVAAALAATTPSRLSFTRDQAGMTATYMPSDEWELYFNLANEWRDGVRPLGSAFFFPSRGTAELVQPIQYRTLELSTGVRFKGDTMQANLGYAGSFFRNDLASVTWDNPALGQNGFIPEQGRISLAPDNDSHIVKGDFAWTGSMIRFASSLSYSAMLQNDALQPHTVNSGLTPIDLSNWNTVASLSRNRADASIETFDGFAQVSATPITDLSLTLEARLRDQDNTTDFMLLNPQTGDYGYIGLDGALSRLYNPNAAGSDVPVRNIPFATDKFDVTAKADYRLEPRTRINFSYAHKEQERRYREVAKSTDNVLTGQISSIGHDWGTVRLSYEYADRSGSDYVPDPYVFARSAGLAGYVPRATGDAPYALNTFRKYDVADRTEHFIRAQTNFILDERTDLQLSGSYKGTNYDAEYGLKSLDSYDLNGSVTSQISDALTVSGFYSFQSHRREVSSINPQRTSSGDDTAGGPNYPLEDAWDESVDDKNHVVGANLHYELERVSLDLNYTYSYANSEFAYAYASLGAISGALTAAEAGAAFPDERFEHHVFEVSIAWPFTDQILLRGYYRLEHETLADFHYDGLPNVVGNHIFLGAVPEDYTANVIGLFTQFRF